MLAAKVEAAAELGEIHPASPFCCVPLTLHATATPVLELVIESFAVLETVRWLLKLVLAAKAEAAVELGKSAQRNAAISVLGVGLCLVADRIYRAASVCTASNALVA